ncbi:MAG: competence/damage-inducible protein A [Clostridiales bacterium GWF2_38_85]|nr:MAG: competence/damage-inducible protein A [Clostridiales bacterium GWF2_38_85]HBL85508.1 competence/damage-inducible protein A [Clostridiales bacterium]
MNAEIICVGTELLLGDVLNTHSAFISRNVSLLGINIFYHTVVGDNKKRLRDTIKTALDRSDMLFLTGGLGPTYDDITKNTVFELLGLKSFVDEAALNKLKGIFEKFGRPMTDNNISQVMRSENSFFFENEFGTAPGLCVETETKTIIMLPGPPRELIPMFNNYVSPYLQKKSDCILFSKNIRYFGIGESSLEAMLKDLMESSTNPTIAPYVDNNEVKLRVTAKAETKKAAEIAVDKMIEQVLRQTGEYCYGIDVKGLEEALVKYCIDKQIKIATAESCTGGLISQRLTSVPGASAVFEAGVCCYANRIKTKMLGVSEVTLEKYGAVSEQTAEEMAAGALQLSGADIAVSITGIAGPDGETLEKPVGTVFVGIATKEVIYTKMLSLGTGTRSRDDIRNLATSHALKEMLDTAKRCNKHMGGSKPPPK